MKTIHFAIASIFYHKKAMVLYTLVSFFAVIGLIVTFALIYSMDQVNRKNRVFTNKTAEKNPAKHPPCWIDLVVLIGYSPLSCSVICWYSWKVFVALTGCGYIKLYPIRTRFIL